jgi:Tfp pilus assembly major pilin PilA
MQQPRSNREPTEDVPGDAAAGEGADPHARALTALAARKTTEQEGSTIIGLLVGIIILAILAAVVALAVDRTTKSASVAGTTTKSASVAGTTRAASVAACNQTVKTVETALEAYKAETPTGNYPRSLAALTTKTTDTPTNPRGPWLSQIPSAQLAKNGYAITYTGTATGKLTVKTKNTTLPGSTPTACRTA